MWIFLSLFRRLFISNTCMTPVSIADVFHSVLLPVSHIIRLRVSHIFFLLLIYFSSGLLWYLCSRVELEKQHTGRCIRYIFSCYELL
jgi:hypothetical protein